MDHATAGSITECAEYLHVDFGSSSCLEIAETYRGFARLCIGRLVSRAMLTAGDNDPEGHRRLSEALFEMARAAGLPPDFKLALVPSTPSIRAVYDEAQRTLRAIGLNAWVFDAEAEAVEWLEGRATGGLTVS